MKHRRMARLGAVLAVVTIVVVLASPVVADGPGSPEVRPIDWSNLLQVTLQGMLAAALPIAVGFGVAWLRAKTNEVLSGLDVQTRWLAKSAISGAVLAAEQSGLAGRFRFGHRQLLQWQRGDEPPPR